MRRAVAALLACVPVLTPGETAAQPAQAPAVEFYNAALDHWFSSPLAADIEALDSGRFRGWSRSGESFATYLVPGAGVVPGAGGAFASPVCRFYIPPERGDSHFLSASPPECAEVEDKVATDPNYRGYVLEARSAFFVALPDPATGACAAGGVPVYRLWNARGDSNHRYVVDPAVKARMVARGYVAEGYGPDAVAMCAPALPPPLEARVTGLSPFDAGCVGPAGDGTLFVGAEVEPHLAVNPRDPDHLVGAWQQDRWSDGGAAGVRSAFSTDGGRTWTIASAPFSRCTGGTTANGGDYDRATDPWVSIAPDGTVHQIVLALKESLLFGESTAILASRSVDGGRTWSDPATLIRDGAQFFNDKETITADPADARFVYATWDRLAATGGGPTVFARSTDGGMSWEPARTIYDPGPVAQTINNQIVVLPGGALVNFFTLLRWNDAGRIGASLALLRSADRGVSWSGPVVFADRQSVGTRDPETGREVRDAAILGSIAVGPTGALFAVWQDARFAGGPHDAIAFARSDDGGLTWSAPVRVNGDPAVAAFVPTVAVSGDGTVGVTYYDLRSNTADPATLLTDVWLARSTDGIVWRESRVAGPFDLAAAPFARGLFLGDYAGLVAAGGRFVPFYARVNVGDAADRSDVWSGFAVASSGASGKRGEDAAAGVPDAPAHALVPGERTYEAEPAPRGEPTPELRQRAHAAAERALEARLPARARLSPPRR